MTHEMMWNVRCARQTWTWATSEQWWRERSTHGVVTDFRVMPVRGPGVAGGLLDENFSGLWEVAIVEELGLITCEKGVVDQRVRLLIRGSAQGISLRTDPHRRWRSGRWRRRWGETVKSAKWRVEERSDTQAHETWMTWRALTPWANVACDTLKHACKHEKMWRVRCTVYTPRRLQQIAICHQL